MTDDLLDFDFHGKPLEPIGTLRCDVAVRTDCGGIVSAIVERHSSGTIFISEAGGGGLGPVGARETVERAIKGAALSVPAEAHRGMMYLATGPQFAKGSTFCRSLARAIERGECSFAL